MLRMWASIMVSLVAALCLACAAASEFREGLRDNPIAADQVTYLDGDRWTASMVSGDDEMPAGLTIPAKVPGDLLSDLYAAGQIGNPYYELNWLNSTIWNAYDWTYATTFYADKDSILVFDGVKMGAKIKVNGVEIGETTDQFLRYVFPLNADGPSSSILEVTFVGASLQCKGRFMACSGGWDWAPYTNTMQEGARTFTKGIWKSVYVASVKDVAIEHFVPHVFYQGDHPTQPLEEGKHAGFQLRARVHLWSAAATKARLTVSGAWGDTVEKDVEVPAGSSNVTLTLDVSAAAVKLWWPSGLGSQPLYEVVASLAGSKIQARRKIGFRHVALVTGDDTNETYVRRAAKEEGTDHHGMFFRVNGVAIMSKGANMIPMEELEGWMDGDAHRILVKSAADANMNTLRVWGGGMFLPDAWYNACDEMGILVFHDMMYAQNGHAPAGTSAEDSELRNMVRRLSHHASIMIWDGCNECQVKMHTETAIYATFVLTVVAEEDASRPIWPSCPAIGWATGVHKLSATPNGNTLTTPDSDSSDSLDRGTLTDDGWGSLIEKHGPYLHGSGFPAVNGGAELSMFDANIPLSISPNRTGVSFSNFFASEFGTAVMSSFESMSPTLAPEHWALHAGQAPDYNCTGEATCQGANVMAQRNYPCDNMIYVYFGQAGQDLNATGEQPFKKSLFQCMIGQALQMKQNIETRLSKNTFGLLTWQYNEIWPTGGWGSIEYGNPSFPGQVIGGRWKPLQYWFRSSIYADVMATCGQGGRCYIRNDAPRPFQGKLTIRSTRFSDGEVSTFIEQDLKLVAGPGALQWFQWAEVANISGRTHVLESIVRREDGHVMSTNVIPFATPSEMALGKSNVAVSASRSKNGTFVAKVTTEAVAMYVTLTTLAHGRFEENAFLLRPPGREVEFLPAEPSPHGSMDAAFESFQKSLRVEDVAAYSVNTVVRDTSSELVI